MALLDIDADIHTVRCAECGRFLGYQAIEVGEMYLFCKNCKGWTSFVAGREHGLLNAELLLARLKKAGHG